MYLLLIMMGKMCRAVNQRNVHWKASSLITWEPMEKWSLQYGMDTFPRPHLFHNVGTHCIYFQMQPCINLKEHKEYYANYM